MVEDFGCFRTFRAWGLRDPERKPYIPFEWPLKELLRLKASDERSKNL